jgi:protein-tyrosine phosphatase
MSSDSPVYVHCKAGKSRSVTATIAYLITHLHWPLNKAYQHVLKQRPCMCPNIGFVTELMRIEERTLGADKATGLSAA